MGTVMKEVVCEYNKIVETISWTLLEKGQLILIAEVRIPIIYAQKEVKNLMPIKKLHKLVKIPTAILE